MSIKVKVEMSDGGRYHLTFPHYRPQNIKTPLQVGTSKASRDNRYEQNVTNENLS